jgi:hypothetical protein
MFHAPTTPDGELIPVAHDRKSMCSTNGNQFFVRCEIEVPLAGIGLPPLGFICWVSVAKNDYDHLLQYRESEETEDSFTELVAGTLANTLQRLADSYATPVKFEVLKGDPTPYVRWIRPETALANMVASGVSLALWHELAPTSKDA